MNRGITRDELSRAGIDRNLPRHEKELAGAQCR